MAEKSIRVDMKNWEEEVVKTKELVMVDFWASWCGPCQMIAPTVEDLAGEYAGRLKVCKLNTDENPEVSSRYQVMGIPTLIFFRDGKMLDKLVGAASKKQFKEKIDSLLAA